MIKNIQGSDIKINWPFFILVYIFLGSALYYFTKDCLNIKCKVLNAFTFGICAYGIYDFTNISLLSGWNIPMAFLDVLWGGMLSAISIYISSMISQNII